MSAIAVSADALDAARRKALFELVRRELRAAHGGLLGAGAPSAAVSRMLDERISLLSADSLLAAERAARAEAQTRAQAQAQARAQVPARSAPGRRDDGEDLGDDPVDLDGVGQ